MDWDEYFIRLAMLVAEKSKDPSTKVGCILVGKDNNVLSTGFNGFPRGVWETASDPENGLYHRRARLHPERWERPLKYDFVEHAERNAVYNAARHGVRLDGARAYLNWEPYPCKDCTKAFIQSGIVEVIGPDIEFPNHNKATGGGWSHGDQWRMSISRTMMDEAGVNYRSVRWPI
jgi:dCMP deaminase